MKLKHALFLLLAAALAFSMRHLDARAMLLSALSQVRSMGFWAPAAFVTAYILASLLFMPGAVLTLGAGALFGLLRGTVYVSIGSTAGAAASFLVGRHLAREWVAKKISGNPKFEAVSAAVSKEGWKIVALTRLSPVFPFNLLNYAFGVTPVSFKDYFLASWIGMLPGTVMYVYIGSLAGTAAEGAGAAQWTLRIIGLLATIFVTLYVTRIASKALQEKI